MKTIGAYKRALHLLVNNNFLSRIKMIISFRGYQLRPIQKKDDRSIAEVIRSVFREFGVNRPGTAYAIRKY